MSKVAVIGAGYVGLTTAACLADLGNDVTVVDVDREKVEQLSKHHVPFYEPGMAELVKRNAESKRLRFTTSYADAIPGAEYAIIAVSTPEGEGGEADLSHVEAAAWSIADAMPGPLVLVNKSTVPPLTGDMVSSVLQKRNTKHQAHVVSNPEFLREGSAIQDFMHPDRVVVGGHDRQAAEKVAKLYEALEAPILITPNIHTAEMVKYASNAFLAARISFINEIARICDRVHADAKLVAAGAHVRGYDPAAMDRTRTLLPELEYSGDAYQLASGADALVVVTEWDEFRQLDLTRLKTSMRTPVVIDGRNIYVPATMRSLGFTYRGIGRE